MQVAKIIVALSFIIATTQAFAGDLITKPSSHSVDVTINRLVAAVEGAGAKVFARIDHAKGSASVGMELRPTQMLMFGNPKLGTPAMQASQTSGLDLPLRVVAYEDENGQVFVAYHPPSDLSDDHGVPADADVLKKMAAALDRLTNKAISE